MAIRLTITEEGSGSEWTRATAQTRVIIGRGRAADVCLPDMAVSTVHAEIRLVDGGYQVIDLGSINGTEVNGKRLPAHRPRRLVTDDVIVVAGFRLRFREGVAPGPAEARDEGLRQARSLADGLFGSGRASGTPRRIRLALAITAGPGRGRRFPLPDPPARLGIGRNPHCPIRLDDADVSREHAEIALEGDQVLVHDVGSRNGIWLDGSQVDAARLTPGRSFSLGATTLTLESPDEARLQAILDAPEEETASYLHSHPQPTVVPGTSPDSADAEPSTIIGPEDPLVDPALARRTTRSIIVPPPQNNSDLGFVVIGAALVIAAVLLLVWFLS